MEGFETTPLVWAKGEDGRRFLCPADALSNLNSVGGDEVSYCIDSDSRLDTREFVPSNDPSGKIKFAKSMSPN